jgi:carboxylate-amine ligase
MTPQPPSLTIGIEEEYQIIDPKTRELRSYITEILKEDVVVLGEVKPELHQSMVSDGGWGVIEASAPPRRSGRSIRRPR